MEKIEEDLLSPAVIAKFHKRFKDDDYDLNDVILRSYEIGRLRGRKDGYTTRNDEVVAILEKAILNHRLYLSIEPKKQRATGIRIDELTTLLQTIKANN